MFDGCTLVVLASANLESFWVARNIKFYPLSIASALDKSIPAAALAQAVILTIHGISEAAMQPFQSTKGPLGGTLAADSNFFFRPGQEFKVSVYEDAKAAGESGLGLVYVDQMKLLGKGTLKLGEGRYVDSVQMNYNPFEMKEGDEKFEAWKKIFDRIGKELE